MTGVAIPEARAIASLAPEVALLFEAARIDSNGDRVARIQAVSRQVDDWPFVVQAALKNRVVPLVFDALRAAEFESVPSAERAELETWFRRCQIDNLAHLREILGLLGDLAARGLRGSPYKGPVLADTLYADLGLRQFYDLDLLVDESELAAVGEVMRARGFTTDDEPNKDDCEWNFRRATDGMLVEVHWDVLPARHRHGYEIESYWQRLVPHSLCGTEVRVLGPEDLLIVLCIHGGEKHRWVRLQMLADIARLLVVNADLDWDVVLDRARVLDREHTVLLGANLAWGLLGAPLDDRIVRLAQTPAIRADTALTIERVARLDSGLPSHVEWRRHLTESDERARARGLDPGRALGMRHYAAAVLKPEWTDRQSLALPPKLEWLYYVYRPFRLLRLHGLRLIRRV